MNILIANFGNESMGLIEYVRTQKLTPVAVVSVDTGWANPEWHERVLNAEAWVKSLGFDWIRLKAKPDFAGLVKAQSEFPSKKFQWCAVYLKGETLRTYLQHIDPLKEAAIFLAEPHALPEHAEAFGERQMHCPLSSLSKTDLQALVAATSFSWLSHRSLECDPCVNSTASDLQRALRNAQVASRLQALEAEMGEAFFDPATQTPGCGSFYGCGL